MIKFNLKNYLKISLIEIIWFVSIIVLNEFIDIEIGEFILYGPIIITCIFLYKSDVKFINGLLVFISKILTLGIAETNFNFANVYNFIDLEIILSFILAVVFIQTLTFLICSLGTIPIFLRNLIHKK